MDTIGANQDGYDLKTQFCSILWLGIRAFYSLSLSYIFLSQEKQREGKKRAESTIKISQNWAEVLKVSLSQNFKTTFKQNIICIFLSVRVN